MPNYEFRDPTTTTAPVANTTAGLFTFTPPVGRVLIANWSGVEVYLRFNSASAASTTTQDFVVLANDEKAFTRDLLGTAISTVSVWFPSGATVASFTIRGL